MWSLSSLSQATGTGGNDGATTGTGGNDGNVNELAEHLAIGIETFTAAAADWKDSKAFVIFPKFQVKRL